VWESAHERFEIRRLQEIEERELTKICVGGHIKKVAGRSLIRGWA